MTSPLTDHQLNTRHIRSLLADIELKGTRRKRIHKLLDENDDIAEVLTDLDVGNIEGQMTVAKELFREREED